MTILSSFLYFFLNSLRAIGIIKYTFRLPGYVWDVDVKKLLLQIYTLVDYKADNKYFELETAALKIKKVVCLRTLIVCQFFKFLKEL